MPPRVVEYLIKMAKEKTKERRTYAVIALGELGDKKAIDPLCDLLHCGNCVSEALKKLGLERNEIDFQEKIRVLRSDQIGDNVHGICREIKELSKMKDIRANEHILSFVTKLMSERGCDFDELKDIYVALIPALREMDELGDHKKNVIGLLNDVIKERKYLSEWGDEIREHAVKALSKHGDVSSIPLLKQDADDGAFCCFYWKCCMAPYHINAKDAMDEIELRTSIKKEGRRLTR